MKTEDQLERIIRMLGSDPGLFLLSLHSFIEGYLKENFTGYRQEESFARNINHYRDMKKAEAGGFLDDLQWNLFNALKAEHGITNQVRHEFRDISPKFAESGSYNFFRFCENCGIESEKIRVIQDNLSIWDNRTSHIEDYRALMDEKWAHFQDQRKLKEILSSLREYEEEKAESAHLSRVLREQEYELKRLNSQVDSQKIRMDEILSEREKFSAELEKIRQSLGSKKDIQSYIDYLRNATYYTRTRMDYEQSLIRLTPEQKGVLERINIEKDFIIRGGAGTGKTLILLEALKRARREEGETLGMEGKKKFLLLTYTTTLVKYNQYISGLMGIEGSDTSICTADSILRDILTEINAAWQIDYQVLKNSIRSLERDETFSVDELCLEIEEFIYGNNLSFKEYYEEMIPRIGMQKPLRQEQRKLVWDIMEQAEKQMLESGSLSQGFACKCILDAVNTGKTEAVADHIFIDESQDLKPVQLLILKKLASRSLILAGDTDQSIYGLGSPYKRASIDISGKSVILKTNFRNSTAIHELAEAYRLQAAGSCNSDSEPEAFRAGPVPELITAEKTEELYARLLDKIRLFLNTLEYSPDNIAVIAPTRSMLDKIEKLLEEDSIPAAQIRENSFDFGSVHGVRLSPLHSSKGLDFPVVMCFLPFLPGEKGIDAETLQDLQKNRVYVALTRAMENLNIFCKEEPKEKALEDIVIVYKKTFTS